MRVKGRWCYLYRAIDATGTTIDFVLSEVPDAAATTRLFRTALTDPCLHRPASAPPPPARLSGAAMSGVH